MKLTTNMRIRNNYLNSQRFSDYLLKIGDGQEATTENGEIRLSNEFCKICPTLENLIKQVYPDITLNIQNIQWFQESAILTPFNEKFREINFTVQEKVPIAARTYYSIDKCLNVEEATSYPVEFFNSLNPSCIHYSAEGWMSNYVATQSGPTEAVQWLQADSESITCSYHPNNHFNWAI
ncbi:hypothetical protein AVEN_17495-1 [Araneus ventricosus]|uniref:Uncharacterized protein n=1 Tax=Araneus ventricosus TaxID=182803 RepID=A0A4Y2JDS8_ARAVE|nr:hypothetical protein AVEN_17495-1 [Araneus ventricosus]